MTTRHHRLVRHAGRLWFFFGVKDRSGRLDLVDIKDDSMGKAAKPEDCVELVGEEFEKQWEAVAYFKGWGSRT